MKKLFALLFVLVTVLSLTPSYSEVEKTPELLRLEKKFATLCPELFKASEELNSMSHEQRLNLILKVENLESDDLDGLTELNINLVFLQDLINKGRKIYMSLESTEGNEHDREQVEMIFVEDTLYMRNTKIWDETPIDQVFVDDQQLDLGLLGYSFLLNHAGDFDRKRLGDKVQFTLNMTDVPVADLIRSLDDKFGEILDAEDMAEDIDAIFNTFEWTFVVDKNNHLVESYLESKLSIYDRWLEETLSFTLDLHTHYKIRNDIVITPPSLVVEEVKLESVEDYKILLNNEPIEASVTLWEQNWRGLLIDAEELKTLIPVTTAYEEDQVTVTMDDQFLNFKDQYGSVIIGDTNSDYYSFPITSIKDGKFYIPLKTAIEFLDGVCLINNEKKEVAIYTPAYLEETIDNKDMDEIDVLASAINKLDTIKRKEVVEISTIKDNYRINSDSYDRVNFEKEAYSMSEIMDIDPVSKYMNYERLVKDLLGEREDFKMQYILFNDKMYSRVLDTDWSNDWRVEEDYLFEWFAYDQVQKFQQLKHLFKLGNIKENTYNYKLDFSNISKEEEIILSRLLYDPMVLDHIYDWPIDAFKFKEVALTYTIDNDGFMKSQDEHYLVELSDGKRSFDCHINYYVDYSEYNKTIDYFVPEISK